MRRVGLRDFVIRDVCLAAVVSGVRPSKVELFKANVLRGTTGQYHFDTIDKVELTPKWRRLGPISPQLIHIVDKRREGDGLTAGQALVYVGGKRSANRVVKWLMRALRAYYRAEADRCESHLSAIVADADANLWNSGRYIRGSVMRNWRDRQDLAAITISTDRLTLVAAKPFLDDDYAKRLTALVTKVKDLVADQPQARRHYNEAILKKEADKHADFFAGLEVNGLTDEQVRAALIFDDVNMVVAAAGSGKTSVIVAKAAYAIQAKLYKPHEIVALAFNNDAAKSLARRVSDKLKEVFNSDISIRSETFHKFGKSYLERGTNRRSKIVELDQAEGKAIFLAAYDKLVKTDNQFREDLFNWLSLARYPEPNLEPSDEDIEEAERRYERACRQAIKHKIEEKPKGATIPTLKPGLFVRSLEEAAIANWLYARDIEFFYENRAGEAVTRALYKGLAEGTELPVYRPDFSYPKPGEGKYRIYHEHFGIGRDGKAPEFMGGAKYVAQAASKRAAYQEAYGWLAQKKGERIPFFETNSGQYRDGTLFSHLRKSLEAFGIPFEGLNQEVMDQAFMAFREASDFEHLLLSFIHTLRGSGLSNQEVLQRADKSKDPHRTKLFLKVAFPLREAVEEAYTDGLIEFSDMISKGATAIQANAEDIPYKLILVDEFQDIARPRMQMINALRKLHKDSVLFFVGDDWQAINRFAGSDLGIFRGHIPNAKDGVTITADTNLYRTLNDGRGVHVVGLTNTFRSAQGIADLARRFITNRKGQIDKDVRAVLIENTSQVVKVIEHDDTPEGRLAAVRAELELIAKVGKIGGELPSAFLLTRNKAEGAEPEGLGRAAIDRLVAEFKGRVGLSRSTMHSSKGLEADYCLIAGLDAGYKGFPNLWDEDPLLELIRPSAFDELGEERRLFYVAMTRAKYKAILFAAGERPSPFVLELERFTELKDRLEWIGSGKKRRICPACEMGALRPIRNNSLLGCSRYPRCGFKSSLVKAS